ncbi:PilZ domain-containing protein [Bacillus timonensis]|nr:PilZ domain-containing protein [Bacillus timonensis]
MVDRRKYLRINMEEYLEMKIVSPVEQNISILINDISYSGIQFTSSSELNLNEYISFIIPVLDPTETIKGKVVRKHQLEDSYNYGIEINRDNEMSKLDKENSYV